MFVIHLARGLMKFFIYKVFVDMELFKFLCVVS